MLHPLVQRAIERLTTRFRRDCQTPGALELFEQLLVTPTAQKSLHDMARGVRHDAQNLPFAARELEQVLSRIVAKRYPGKVFADQQDPLIPWNTEVQRGAQEYTYYLEDETTTAVFLATLADGALPSPELRGAAVTHPVHSIGEQLRWSIEELWASDFANRPLQSRLQAAVLRGHVELLNRTAAWGREDLGLNGFLNNPNIVVRQAATSTIASPNPTHWDAKLPSEIAADVIGLVRSIGENSRQIYDVSVVAMPQHYLNIMSDTLLSDTDEGGNLMTVMDYVVKALTGEGQPARRFRACEDLLAEQSFGNLDEDAIIAFNDDPEFVSLVVPLWFELRPLQESGLHFSIPAVSLVGGVMLPHPLSVARLDGVGSFVPGG